MVKVLQFPHRAAPTCSPGPHLLLLCPPPACSTCPSCPPPSLCPPAQVCSLPASRWLSSAAVGSADSLTLRSGWAWLCSLASPPLPSSPLPSCSPDPLRAAEEQASFWKGRSVSTLGFSSGKNVPLAPARSPTCHTSAGFVWFGLEWFLEGLLQMGADGGGSGRKCWDWQGPW